MNDIVHDASLVLASLASAGAGAAAHDLAEQAGTGLSTAARGILARLRHRLPSEQPEMREIGDALREALAAGEVTEAELKTLVNHARAENASMSAGKNIYLGDISVDGVFNG
jgi:hypothetical protein